MVASKHSIKPAEDSLQLCKGFAACQDVDVLVAESAACCSSCSRQIMWRVELCPACQGSCTGYIFYHIQAGYKAIRSGELRLFFGYFTEEATDEELKDVGHRATQALRDAGISVEWNGDPDETILIKDLTSSEKAYISRRLGPGNVKWAKAAQQMADKMGPVCGGEVIHNCDCMQYTCFCGKIKHLGNAAEVAHACKEEETDADWTTCSEEEFEELQKQGCDCSDDQCGCKAPYQESHAAAREMSALFL